MGFDFSEVLDLADDLAAAPAKVAVGSAVVVARTTQQIAEDAQGFAPVRSGELRDSIRAEVGGLSAAVTAEAPHAAFVEYGTSDTAPQPFMRPAADRNEPQFASDLLDVAAGII